MSRLTTQLTVKIAGLRGPGGTVSADLEALEANVIAKSAEADAAATEAEGWADAAAEEAVFAKSSLTGWQRPTYLIQEGYYHATGTGALTANAAFRTLRIDVTGDEAGIRASATVSGGGTALAIYFNAAGAYLGNQFVGPTPPDAPAVYVRRVLTPPAGTRSIAIDGLAGQPISIEIQQPRTDAGAELNLLRDDMTAAQAGVAGAAAQGTLNQTDINAVKNRMKGWEDVPPGALQAGYYATGTGAFTASVNYHAFKVDIAGTETLRASGVTLAGGVPLAVYFGETDNYLGREFLGNNSTETAYVNQALTLPAGTRKVAISGRVAYPIKLQRQVDRQVGTDIDAANAKIAENTAAVSDWTSITPFVEGQYVSNGGVTNSNPLYRSIRYAIQSSDQKFRVSGRTSGDFMSLAVYFGANGTTVLGTQFLGVTGVATDYTNQELTIPTGTAYIVINGRNSSGTTFQVFKPSAVATRVSAAEANIAALMAGGGGRWQGKTAVWFGTSIPAGSGTNAYPQKVGTLLGMTVTNEAIGSSRARAGVRAKVTAGDAYGWTGMAWQNVAYGLSNTLAEKNDLIDNWETKWRDLLVGTDKPTTLTDTIKNQWRDYSYENKLVARHLGANRKDLYVFDHGHNDIGWYPGEVPDSQIISELQDTTSTAPGETRDRLRFLGSMAYLIDLILHDNPRAKIVFIGHYENARKVWIYQAQNVLAETWDYPFFRLWERLGWTQQIVTSGGMTMTQFWMPDNLHPSSDTSGVATDRIAAVIAAWLATIA